MARYIRYPLVRFHTMKYSIFLGAIPMLIAGLGSIACCDEVVPIRVQTTTITRSNTIVTEAFDDRWQPLSSVPKRVRTIEIKGKSDDASKDARPSVAPADRNVDLSDQSGRQDVAQVEHTELPRSRPRNIRYIYKRDLCARHNRRKVYYGRYRWRCR